MKIQEKITQEEIDTIIESLYNGQYKQAKSQVMEGCKTKPELLAYRVGFIIEILGDRGDNYESNRFLAQFE